MAIARFFKAILEGSPIHVFGDGSARRDFTYVDDIVEGALSAIDHSFANEIINLGGAHTVTVLELIQKISRVTSRTPGLVFEEPRPGDVPATWADSTKAEAMLGRSPRISLDEGLERYFQWLLGCAPQVALKEAQVIHETQNR